MTRPSPWTLLTCAPVWFFTVDTIKLLPLFPGETPVRRGLLDGWLDGML